MTSNHIFRLLKVLLAWSIPTIAVAQSVDLIEPLGSNNSVAIDEGAGTLLNYFNDIGPWVLSVAVGICTLWVLFGGIEIMVAGGDQNRRQQGREHITWAITGLVMLMFAGFLLRSLNSMFFV